MMMMSKLFIYGVLLVCLYAVITMAQSNDYETRYFNQKLDHFNFESGNLHYKQRYLINDKHWGKNPQYASSTCKGPIFFYTGNESPVTDYYKASGFITDVLAPQYGALILFAEHRYFGESMPFGDQSFDLDKIGYCSTQQALADYATLLTSLKQDTLPNAKGCPVFAFGGSYGGMLTTWFRIKYPNIVMGGLAASAPFAFQGSGISPYAFTEAASQTYETARPGCGVRIKSGFDLLQKEAQTQAGRNRIEQAFKLCFSLNNVTFAEDLINWITSGLIGASMLDYPYPTDYGISIGGWPVNNTCDEIANGDLLEAFGRAIGVWYNHTGDKKCFNFETDGPDWGKCCGWDYLACTEVYVPSGQNGIFPYAKYDVQADIQRCKEQFGVTLDPSWPETVWGGFDSLKSTSNIIFSNGLLDPWHTSGVLQNISDSLVAIVIPEAAHHLDLRGPNKDDPIYVTEARKQENALIGKWLKEYFDNN